MEDRQNADVCRVCRCEASHDKPLFYPCLCTGSIKYIHQECLVQWLKYSKKEYCELCKHKFIFTPIYAPDMPKRLPIKDIISGLLRSVSRAVRYWLHYTLVTIAWLGVVPIAAGRIYRCLFSGSLLNFSLDIFSSDNLLSDSLLGCVVMVCTLCTFVGLVWLREQILHGNGGVEWLDNVFWGNNNDNNNNVQNGGAPVPQGEPVEAGPLVPVENVVEEQEQNNQAPDDNWNPMDWDRGPEELTWERLLGLDGSLLFLEHVFWVISLNTLFILVFAFFPYHVGHSVFIGLNMKDSIAATKFEGLLSTLLGYLLTASLLFLFYITVSLFRLPKAAKLFGICYTCVKVTLLIVMEIGIFPLICGWWLDICSLSMFDASVKDRISGFKANPATSMFFHWLVGMVYIFYFASFILLLREILRPGVLWFLRNLNDPDFNPVQEMIHLPVYRHVRRFLASLVVFGTIVLIMIRLPALFIHSIFPDFLPYRVTLSSPDLPISELSLELLLLQVILPAVLEQGQSRQWAKSMLRWWCMVVSYVLGIRSYLLGDDPGEEEQTKDEVGLEANDPDVEENFPETEEAEISEGPSPSALPEDPRPSESGDIRGSRLENIDLISLVIENKLLVESTSPALDSAQTSTAEESAGRDLATKESTALTGQVEESGQVPVELAEDDQEDHVENPEPQVVEEQPADAIVPQPVPANNIFANRIGPLGFKPYKQPTYFAMRIACLVALICFTLFFMSLLSITVPVSIGRQVMFLSTGTSRVHELYTAASGLYICWLCLRVAIVLCTWIPKGSKVIRDKCKEYFFLLSKTCIAVALIVGLIPLLLGLLFELFVVIPVRVPLNQTPIFSLGQDWALGVLHAKIITACTLIGPQWRLRRVIEQVYGQGLRNMDLKLVVFDLCLPVIIFLGLILAVPYVTSRSIIPALGFSFEVRHTVERQIYPFLLVLFLLVFFCVFQARQFKRLYEHIKNDKYLVGQRLVNYEKRA